MTEDLFVLTIRLLIVLFLSHSNAQNKL